MKADFVRIKLLWAIGLIFLTLVQCQPGNQLNKSLGKPSVAAISQEPFGTTKENQPVSLFTLRNKGGVEVKITNYGGIITSLLTPDKNGQSGDVVLGFDKLTDYETRNPFFGALVGRFGNRIAGGKFTLNGQEYTLEKNNGPNHLHGGRKGFDKVVWQPLALPKQNALQLTYVSPDGEESYPGTLTTVVTYTLTPQNELRIDYRAHTTKPTPINLTNHSYFNLTGSPTENILGHSLFINADSFTVVDKTLIPTGEIKSVVGTDYDFTQAKPIGDGNAGIPGGGYDLNYVLNKKGKGLILAARSTEPTSGRVMEVFTTQPGVQLYTGQGLSSRLIGKKDQAFQRYAGFCLETQHFPDSPNQPNFPTTILRPQEEYKHTTIYKFSVQK